MAKYWAVTTAFYDNGRVTANIVTSVEADQKPQAGYKETRRCDIYTDWFDAKEKAEAFVNECREG